MREVIIGLENSKKLGYDLQPECDLCIREGLHEIKNEKWGYLCERHYDLIIKK